MPPTPIMPAFVPGLAVAGVEALRHAVGALAPWQLRAPIDTSQGDARALAGECLGKLAYPEHLFALLPPDAQDRVAVAVGVGPLADFRPATAEADVAISWETAVLAVLCRREAPPPPSLRVPRSEPRHDDRWPELA